MSIKKVISTDSKQVSIEVDGRFDFSLHQAFRESYADAQQRGTEFKLDLSKATYMDSSALGMILMLKEHAEQCSSNVVIYKPNDTVSKILEIAQFHRLMTIEA